MSVVWLREKNGLTGTKYEEMDSQYNVEKGHATHVRITVDEYEKLLSTIASYKKKLSEEQTAHQKDVNAEKKKSVEANNTVVDKVNEAMKKATERVAIAEAEAERQKNLNKNLLRIARERANAKRGLQPKKSHCGYRFSGKITQTKVKAGYDKKSGVIYADAWTATLESPYDATIPIHQIEDQVFKDLRGSDGILNKLYVNYWTLKNDPDRIWKGDYQSAIDDEVNPEKKNYLFDYKFMINPKSQLWEIQITTTKSIRPLDEMMGPRRRKKEQEEAKKKEIVDDFPLFDRLAPDL